MTGIFRFRLGLGLLVLVLVGTGFVIGQNVQAALGVPEPGSADDPLVSRSYVDQYVRQEIVVLQPGQELVAQAGTEFVVRSGKAVALGAESGGLADLTAGTDVGTGRVLQKNHLFLVPRSDGRGVRAQTTVILLVRGPFTLK